MSQLNTRRKENGDGTQDKKLPVMLPGVSYNAAAPNCSPVLSARLMKDVVVLTWAWILHMEMFPSPEDSPHQGASGLAMVGQACKLSNCG